MMEWDDSYLVGVEEIDMQHKRLFSIAKEADLVLKDEYKFNKYDDVKELVGKLRAYTQYHFEQEELIMFKAGYQGLKAHMKLHKGCIEEIDHLIVDSIDCDQDENISYILNFVIDWIIEHIAKVDKNMAKIITGRAEYIAE